MKRVKIHDAKKGNRKKIVRKPRIGVAKGAFVVPESFFEPLPEAFRGE